MDRHQFKLWGSLSVWQFENPSKNFVQQVLCNRDFFMYCGSKKSLAASMYKRVSERTIQRDLAFLRGYDLIKIEKGMVKLNLDVMDRYTAEAEMQAKGTKPKRSRNNPLLSLPRG